MRKMKKKGMPPKMKMMDKKGGKKSKATSREKFIKRGEDALGDQPI